MRASRCSSCWDRPPRPRRRHWSKNSAAPRFAERERATEARATRGPEAPARACVPPSTPRVPEVRMRAAALVEKTEALLLTQPTLVTLDLKDRPVDRSGGGHRRAGRDQAGPVPPRTPRPGGLRVTLQESSPVAILEGARPALRRGEPEVQPRDAGVVPQPGAPASRSPRGRRRARWPTSDLGPFRVQLTNLNFQRNLTFAAGPRPNEQFYIQVQVVAEPRLSGQPERPAPDPRGRGRSGAVADAPRRRRRTTRHRATSA